MNEMSSIAASGPDERRSAAIAASKVDYPAYARRADSFALVRTLLRSPSAQQDLPLKGEIPGVGPEQRPVIMLDGELHRRRRTSLARFFSPKAIKDTHFAVMEATTSALMAQLRRTGRGQLDLMSMQLACDVAATIVGLTDSDPAAMARRIRLTFESSPSDAIPLLGPLLRKAKGIYKSLTFFQFQQDLVTPTGNTGELADYPTLGVDKNALYIGTNNFGASFTSTTGFVVRKSSVLGAGPIVVTAFRNLAVNEKSVSGNDPVHGLVGGGCRRLSRCEKWQNKHQKAERQPGVSRDWKPPKAFPPSRKPKCSRPHGFSAISSASREYDVTSTGSASY